MSQSQTQAHNDNCRNKRTFWENHIEHWRHSGLSQMAYCREQELKFHQFHYWRKRLKQSDPGISFVPLRFSKNVPAALTLKPAVNLITPNGYRVEVGPGFDMTTLKQLLDTVRSI